MIEQLAYLLIKGSIGARVAVSREVASTSGVVHASDAVVSSRTAKVVILEMSVRTVFGSTVND